MEGGRNFQRPIRLQCSAGVLAAGTALEDRELGGKYDVD
jgi:hypothetical protein